MSSVAPIRCQSLGPGLCPRPCRACGPVAALRPAACPPPYRADDICSIAPERAALSGATSERTTRDARRTDRCDAQPIVEEALALLALAKARLEEATAPEPVRFDRPRRVTLPPVIEDAAAPEVVRLQRIYNPPPIMARGLLSIFA